MDINSFIGVWSLISLAADNINEKETVLPWGEDIAGQLIYTPSKHMAVVYMQNGRPRFMSEEKACGTYKEIIEAFIKFDAYAGIYDFNLQTGKVTHNVIASREPNLEGDSLVRDFKLADNILELVTPPIHSDGREWKITLKWERVG